MNLISDGFEDLYNGDVIDIECETGYSLAGDNKITCIKDSSYQFNEQPKCLIGKCLTYPPQTSQQTNKLLTY